MNPQISAVLRNILIAGGGAVAMKFGLSADMVPTVVGIIMSLGGAAWSAWGHSRNSVIASAAALPEVRAILTSSEIANSSQFANDNKVVTPTQAGTAGLVR